MYCQLEVNSFYFISVFVFVFVLGFHRLKTLKILWLSCWIYMVIVLIVPQLFNLLQMGTSLENK